MSSTTNLQLPTIAAAQAQKHVTHNQALSALDAVVQLNILDQTLASPPASPAEGDRYSVASGATGDWAGFDGQIAAYQDGVWSFYSPQEGWLAWDVSQSELYVYTASAWQLVDTFDATNVGTQVGVNAWADSYNRLTVKSDAVLLSHDDVTPGSGDVRVTVNKSSAGNTAIVAFQNAYSGRAELGLTGDDQFRIRVSADGGTFTDGLVMASDGAVQLAGELTTAKLVISKSADNAYFYTGKDDTGGACAWTAANSADSTSGEFRLNFSSQTYGAWEFSVPSDTAWGQTQVLGVGADRVEITNTGLVVGAPSGGAKGAGVINAEGVYDDNTLLSCYVFDQAIDGAIDPAKWDSVVPQRLNAAGQAGGQHVPMRKFQARIGTDYDPLTLDGYARHWREKRHLSSLPNEVGFDPKQGLAAGEWIQRLVETVEIQAVLIEQLNTRMHALESR